MINLEYSPVLIFLLFAFGLSAVIVLASYALGVKKPDSEKSNVYECGFSPYSDSRSQFEVRFFLVGILFIIFDLEISFLFPWSVSISELVGHVNVQSGVYGADYLMSCGSDLGQSGQANHNIFGYWTMMIFLIVLTVGLIYEWLKGGLEWE